MRIIDDIAPTSEPFHVTIQIISFPSYLLRRVIWIANWARNCVRLCQESGCYTSSQRSDTKRMVRGTREGQGAEEKAGKKY